MSVTPDSVAPMRVKDGDAHAVSPLLDSWTTVPAMAYDDHLDIVAVNRLGRRVLGISPGENLARATFLNEGINRSTAEWDQAATAVAGALRTALEVNSEDEDFLEMVGELAAISAEFPRMWAQWPEEYTSGEVTCWPAGEALALRYTMLRATEHPGITICVYQARDTAAARLLELHSTSL